MHIWQPIRFELLQQIQRVPALYNAVYSLWDRENNYLTDQHTQVVIEGFPRSANTFAVFAFRHAQTVPVRIAHHIHSPTQIVTAVKLGTPAALLFRDPLAAIASLLVREEQYTIYQALRFYRNFYSPLLVLHEHYVLASFEETISDFGEVIRRINHRFETEFVTFRHSPENVETIFSTMRENYENAGLTKRQIARRASLPDAARRDLTGKILTKLCDPRYSKLLGACRDIYSTLSELHEQQRNDTGHART
ncbi:hypothetical protein [Rubinisphaera brasiliensis]|uniref:Sulfotransferase n=1 Tax=Rubinisphaera brasiliensis (strain ATCC 49424 / DSM 5305 / JCM 21570 / IAM 15109 / NBRC 103401 / IFAM 1448) TaxID=756272 RepID=F0SNN0_RUBBR|nr:hypothetical protein [Rubinisphaera brasiliensis]ADY58916.1 hypothetical protein Plabr_1304 [Rubinisphaera brasiliensis DSM 5305]